MQNYNLRCSNRCQHMMRMIKESKQYEGSPQRLDSLPSASTSTTPFALSFLCHICISPCTPASRACAFIPRRAHRTSLARTSSRQVYGGSKRSLVSATRNIGVGLGIQSDRNGCGTDGGVGFVHHGFPMTLSGCSGGISSDNAFSFGIISNNPAGGGYAAVGHAGGVCSTKVRMDGPCAFRNRVTCEIGGVSVPYGVMITLRREGKGE